MKPDPNQRLKDELAEVIESRAGEAKRAQVRLQGARLAWLMVEDWTEEQIRRAVSLLNTRAPEPWARGLFDADGCLTPEARCALELLQELLTPEPKDG